jgi:methyl-accepting chemotaxis protein
MEKRSLPTNWSSLRQVTIRKKLWLCFAAVDAAVIALGIFLLVAMESGQAEIQKLIKSIQTAASNLEAPARDIAHAAEEQLKMGETAGDLFVNLRTAKQVHQQLLENFRDPAKVQSLVQRLQKLDDESLEKATLMRDVVDNTKRAVEGGGGAFDNMKSDLRTFMEVGKLTGTMKALEYQAVLGIVAIFGFTVLVSLWLSRSISGPLVQTVRMMRDIAERRDLTQRVDVQRRDELGDVAHWFNTMIASIHDSVVQVREAAEHTAIASQQLSAAAGQLTSGAQTQASSLEETAASLEEITATVKQNADSASEVNQHAAGSRETAEKGGRVVRDAVAAMAEINQASRRIADIISTIDEIAFQTNLLALNAAVEAARAGDQGRGFAVVAAEVRNLAQRSATAAKEIKALIRDSVQKVESGSTLVTHSGASLEEIVSAVRRVTEIIAEIASASREQSAGIDQVNRAVADMSRVTQSNASQTEEVSATAEMLAEQARRLQSLVSQFRVEHAEAPVVAADALPAPPAPPARFGSPERRRSVHPTSVLIGAGGGNGVTHVEGNFEEF